MPIKTLGSLGKIRVGRVTGNTHIFFFGLMNYFGLKLVLRAQPHPQFLKWYKTFSWLFGSHDNPLTRQ